MPLSPSALSDLPADIARLVTRPGLSARAQYRILFSFCRTQDPALYPLPVGNAAEILGARLCTSDGRFRF